MATSPIIPDLAQRLTDLHTTLIDIADAADRLDDPTLSWDVGLALLSARDSVATALGHIKTPRSTVVHSPALDAAYAEIDALFVS
jgi:hypothetical protein